MNVRHLSISAALLFSAVAHAQTQNQHKPSVPPDLVDVSYGPHQRNVFDLWKAKSDRPTPLVIFIHGGGFVAGGKDNVSAVLVDTCLQHGVSVAAINYRYSTQAPYPGPMRDGARAVQFLRLYASDYNLNPKAFGATGGSAGAGISLWVGFHDEMADPASDDPLERQSTRLSAMAVSDGQTTYDPRVIAKLINPETGRHQALRTLFSVKQGEDSLQATDAFPRYEDGSAVTHLTADDPPVFLYYSRSNTPPPPGDLGTGIHHPRFGYFLKEKMDKLGIECIVKIKDDYEGKPPGQPQRDMVDFFVRHFPSGE